MVTVTVVIGVTDISANVDDVDTWRNKQNNIGTCKLKMQNPANVYGGVFSTNDAISITVDDGAAVEIWTGFVNDVKPYLSPKGVYTNEMVVTGSDRGRYGADLYLTKKYADQDMDEIIDDALFDLGDPWTFNDPGATPNIKYEFRRTYLTDAIREICDLAGYDSYITNAGLLTIFVAGANASGVALKAVLNDATNTLLSFEEYEQVAKGIRNVVEVSAGSVKDHYTDENGVADWSVEDDGGGAPATVSDDTAKYIWGRGSIYLGANGDVSRAFLDFTALKYGYGPLASLDLSKPCQAKVFLSAERGGGETNVTVNPYMIDRATRRITFTRKKQGAGSKGYTELVPDWTAIPLWRVLTYPLGDTNQIQAAARSGYWHGNAAFDWTDVAKIGFEYTHTEVGEVWIDGWNIPSLDAKDIVRDAVSEGAYDTRMFHQYKNNLKSMTEITALATRLLALKKDPVQKFKAVAKGQTGTLYAAQTLTIQAPQHGIAGATAYIISKLHHKVRRNAITRGFDFTTTYDLVVENTLASRVSDNREAERIASLMSIVRALQGGTMDNDILIGDAETGTQTAVESGTPFPLDPNDGDLFDLTADLAVGAARYYGPSRYWYDETLGDWYRNPMTFQRGAFPAAGGEVLGDELYRTDLDTWYRWTGAWTVMNVAAGTITGEVTAAQLAIEQRDWHSNLNFIWDVANKDWDEIWWGLFGNEVGADAVIEFSDGTTTTIDRNTEAALADGTYIYYWDENFKAGGTYQLQRDTFANWDNGVGAGKGIVAVVTINEAGADSPSFNMFNSYSSTIGVGLLSAWTVKTHHLTAEEIQGKDIATQANVGIAAGNPGIRMIGDAADIVGVAIGDAIGGVFTAGIWGFKAGPTRTFYMDPATGDIIIYDTGSFKVHAADDTLVGYVGAFANTHMQFYAAAGKGVAIWSNFGVGGRGMLLDPGGDMLLSGLTIQLVGTNGIFMTDDVLVHAAAALPDIGTAIKPFGDSHLNRVIAYTNLRVPVVAGSPGVLANGDVWIDTTA